MAHVVETAIVHGVEGKTRAQQIARLREWKKHFLSEGVEKVVLSEVGAGNIDGAWILAIQPHRDILSGTEQQRHGRSPHSRCSQPQLSRQNIVNRQAYQPALHFCLQPVPRRCFPCGFQV